VGEDLARFQKLLFWTFDITPHPSPALVFHTVGKKGYFFRETLELFNRSFDVGDPF
jgi:hypothetical protein